MPPSVLPTNPSIEQLKGQAKHLLRAFRASDPAVVPRFKGSLPHLAELVDGDFFAAKISLKDAQQVIARQYGFADWAALKRHVEGEAQYFADYRWSDRVPVGVDPLADPPQEQPYYKFVRRANGIHLEQYDARGDFVRLCHQPDDDRYYRRWHKERLAGDSSAVVCDDDGSVVRYEKYHYHDEHCADGPLISSDIFTVEGRLIERQQARKVSHTAYDLYVEDGCGKFKGIIHHAAVDRGEPYDISEDWVD
ncbi:MAG: hypothetical protein GKR89_33760 [Candidatus Latescibacteria bacterium]|nr:hypothetical protein [Candidatus Latescibacterota bacterium]